MSSQLCFSQLAQSPIATIIIHSGDTYNIHKSLLCSHSASFAYTLLHRSTDVITVSHWISPSPMTMNLFVDYIYTGRLDPDNKTWLTARHMLHANLFGQTFKATEFHAAVHNATVDLLVSGKVVPRDDDGDDAFEYLDKGNPLQGLLVELEVKYSMTKLFNDPMNDEHLALLEKRCDAKERGEVSELVACDWHVHGSEEEKAECGRVGGERG